MPQTSTEKGDINNTRAPTTVRQDVDNRGYDIATTVAQDNLHRPMSIPKNRDDQSTHLASTSVQERSGKPKSTHLGLQTPSHGLPAEETQDSSYRPETARPTVGGHQKSHTRTETITEVPSPAINPPKASKISPILQPGLPSPRLEHAPLHQLLDQIGIGIQQSMPAATNLRTQPQSSPLTPLRSAQNAKPIQRTLSR